MGRTMTVWLIALGACTSNSGADAGTYGALTDASIDVGHPPDGEADGGDSDAGLNDGDCWLVSLTVFRTGDPGVESRTIGIAPNGQAMGLDLLSIEGCKNAIWFADGGVIVDAEFRDITMSAISDTAVCGTIIDSPIINPRQAYRRKFGEPVDVLSNEFVSSDAQDIDAHGNTVGSIGGTPAEWRADGGPGRRAIPDGLGVASVYFSAIDDRGRIVGGGRTNQYTWAAVTVDADSWRLLPCQRMNCYPLALAGDQVVGYAASGPSVPVRWSFDTGAYEELETRGDVTSGVAIATRADGVTGGSLAPGNSSSPGDAVAAFWRGAKLAWLAPSVGPANLKIVSIVGVADRGLVFAANCYDGDQRAACRLELECK